MDDRRVRPGVWIALLASLSALALVVFLGRRQQSGEEPAAPVATPEETAEAAKAPAGPGPRLNRSAAGAPDGAVATPEEAPPYIENWLYGDLDLREVQLVMPDNLYWELASPTKDPEILAKREQEKARRNEEYGRVIAGDANEQEVDAYYDYRERLSSDYLEFAEYVKRRFGDKVDEQFNGLLDLSIKLHTAKLAQLPSEREDARHRSRERARIREDWQREQAEFEAARRAAEAE